MQRTAFGVAAIGALVACAASDRPRAVAPAAAPDAEAPLATPDAAAGAEGGGAPEAADAVPPPLPSGDYEITTEVLKDTCTGRDGGSAAPAPTTMFVPMKVWRDRSGNERVTGNFPLPLPRKGGFGSARSDITLAPRVEPQHVSLRGLGSRCPSYETRTVYEVLERSADAARVAYSRDYGDGSACGRKVPSGCALEYVYTFRLVRGVCSPYCGVRFVKDPEAGVSPKCLCDGGGA